VDKKFYQDLLDQISDGVYFVTLDRRITYWNGGAERITGYGAHEVLGHRCSEGILRHVDDTGQQLCLHGCPLAAVMKDGRPREAHLYLHHKDGHRVPVTVRPRPCGTWTERSLALSRSPPPGQPIPTRAGAGTAMATRWIP